MATIVTVHGTFANVDETLPAEAAALAAAQWWQPGSPFDEDVRRLVTGSNDEPVEVHRFIWNGENSESARRAAAHRLYNDLIALEARKERYAVIGHSHGGSIVSLALLHAAARRNKLEGLQRWITIGTPFIELKREPLLFTRVTFLYRAIFVASLMLLIMFAFTAASDLLDGSSNLFDQRQAMRLAVGFGLTALPFVLVYAGLKFMESRQRYLHRPRVAKRAREWFGTKWLSLTHRNDEAVQGLSTLSNARFRIFERNFAVPSITMASVFLLPLAYLFVVTTPSLMVSLADYFKTRIYEVQQYEARQTEYEASRKELREINRDIRSIQQQLDGAPVPFERASDMRRQVDSLRADRAAKRTRLDQKWPDLAQAERAIRFKRRFFELDGKPCEGGRLCHGGRHIGLNSKLLFHLVTDEVASAVVDEEFRRSIFGNVVRFAIPVLLVPLVFGALAIGIVFLVQMLAKGASALLAGYLDRLTWSEIKRVSLGNDTESEIALGAGPHPVWIDVAPPFLPEALSNELIDHSNRETALSLAKFRNALSEFAFADQGDRRSSTLSQYLSWRELIHTSYFEVPGFRRLIASALCACDAFKCSSAYLQEAGRERTESMLSELAASPSASSSAAALMTRNATTTSESRAVAITPATQTDETAQASRKDKLSAGAAETLRTT